MAKLTQFHPNFSEVEQGGLTVYYSYATPIAFRDKNGHLTVRHNDWSNTTGKHLNEVCPDKSKRVDGTTFESLLSAEETE